MSAAEWGPRIDELPIQLRSKVRIEDDCWMWTGSQWSKGRPRVWLGNTQLLAYRYAYMWFKGYLPPGWDVHHLCERPLCINPDHLFPDNGPHRGLHARRKTHCKYNHEFTDQNTYRYEGKRYCRTCANDYQKKHNRKYGAFGRGRRSAKICG